MKTKNRKRNEFESIADLHYCDLDPNTMMDSDDGDY